VSDETDERSTETIQADILETREQLGDTVAALGHKSDVKGRAEDRISETRERVTGAAQDAAAKAQEAMPAAAQDGMERARAFVRSRPVEVSAAIGFLAGLAIGRRRR
jgi:ElaB/YqjD/DUF883 family membrane-anchored ribosome-binding protein